MTLSGKNQYSAARDGSLQNFKIEKLPTTHLRSEPLGNMLTTLLKDLFSPGFLLVWALCKYLPGTEMGSMTEMDPGVHKVKISMF